MDPTQEDIVRRIQRSWTREEKDYAESQKEAFDLIEKGTPGIWDALVSKAAERVRNGHRWTCAMTSVELYWLREDWEAPRDGDGEAREAKAPSKVLPVAQREIIKRLGLGVPEPKTITVKRCPVDVLYADLPAVQRLYAGNGGDGRGL